MPILLLLLLVGEIWAQVMPCDFKDLHQPTLEMDSLHCTGSKLDLDRFELEWRNWSMTHGYLFAKLKWKQMEVLDHWQLSADFGPMYVLEDLWPLGQTQTSNQILLRMAGLKKGSPINIDWPAETVQRLKANALFKVGNAWYARRNQRHRMVLPIEINDLPTNEVKAQLGGSLQQWQGALELNFPNLAHTGRSLSFALYGMENARQLNFDYLEPWLWSLNLGLKMHVDWQSKDTGAQHANLSLELRDFWTVPQSLGLRLGLSSWQDSVLKPWENRFWTGFHYLYKTTSTAIDFTTDRIWETRNSSTRVDFKVENEFHLWAMLGIAGMHRSAWTDLELDPKVQFWDFKLRPVADFRGLRSQISSRKFIASQKELFFRGDLVSMGMFADHLLRSEIKEWEWVWGPSMKFKNTEHSSMIGLSYALNPNGAIDQGLVHLELVHRF